MGHAQHVARAHAHIAPLLGRLQLCQHPLDRLASLGTWYWTSGKEPGGCWPKCRMAWLSSLPRQVNDFPAGRFPPTRGHPGPGRAYIPLRAPTAGAVDDHYPPALAIDAWPNRPSVRGLMVWPQISSSHSPAACCVGNMTGMRRSPARPTGL